MRSMKHKTNFTHASEAVSTGKSGSKGGAGIQWGH